jgi:hypothetical protein
MILSGLTITGVTLTDEAVDRIFETAIDAGHTYGFGYWARLIGTRVAQLPEGGQLRSIGLQERESSLTHWIEKADLERGIGLMLGEEAIDEDRFDGPQAERVIQYAIFGEVKYG